MDGLCRPGEQTTATGDSGVPGEGEDDVTIRDSMTRSERGTGEAHASCLPCIQLLYLSNECLLTACCPLLVVRIMGCVYSARPHIRPPLPTASPRSFHVVNVDDRGNEINAGEIQVTDTDLVLRQGESSILWPLRSLRRYGFDAELFSFECGRRCPTGPGIYAFRCTQAEELFNNLQEAINKCTSYPPAATAAAGVTSNHVTTGSGSGITGPDERSVRDSSQQNQSHPPISSPAHSYVNAIHNYISSPIYTGPPSEHSISMPLSSHELPTTGVTDINTNYAKLDDLLVRYYVNINTPAVTTPVVPISPSQLQQQAHPSSTSTPPIPGDVDENKDAAVTANGLSSSGRSQLVSKTPVSGSSTGGSYGKGSVHSGTRFKFPPATSASHLPPLSSPSRSQPVSESYDPVNYIMLDLDVSTPAATPAATSHFVSTAPATPVSKTPKSEVVWPSPPDTQLPGTPTSVGSADRSIVSNGTRMSYAMIDFDKTDALTSAANQRKGLSIESSS